MAGERYLGRIVVEFDYGVIFPAREPPGPGDATPVDQTLLERAIAALEASTDPAPTPPVWPQDRAITAGPDAIATFRGRVVIELWEQTVHVAVTARRATSAELVREAAIVLRGFRGAG